MAVDPFEYDAPLVVDADAPLPGAIAFQLFEPVAGRYTQIVDFPRGIDKTQLAHNVMWIKRCFVQAS